MRWILAVSTIIVAMALPDIAWADCATEARYLRMQLRYKEAEQTARECIEEQDKNADAYVELSRALAAQDDHDEAMQWAERALEVYPERDSLKLLKARLLAWTGRADEALELIESLPEEVYEHSSAMRLRADVLLWNERYDKAVIWYDRYDEQDPDNPLVLFKRGLAYRGMGEHARAVDDMDKSCEIAPQATEACEALEDFAQSSFPKVYANLHYGYSRVVERLDGWTLRGEVGSDITENLTVMGNTEWLNRPFGDERQADWRFNTVGAYQFDAGPYAKTGGGFTPDATFSPQWNAFVEPGWTFEDFKAGLRFWHVQFPDVPVEVLNPNFEVYLKPWMFEFRYFMALENGGDQLYHSGFARAFYFFTNLTQFYVGGGLGDKSDFLEPREVDAQSHWLVTAGFRYMLNRNHRLMISVIQRTDQADVETYDQMETLVGYEFRL
ncbi:MAG: tetratricopeptide repeat protein [Persicimonas sp.]